MELAIEFKVMYKKNKRAVAMTARFSMCFL